MSAETLRRAAALIRERATHAEEYAFLSPNDMAAWACDGSWIQPEDELISEHYAALSPAVALAAADWLDSVADLYGDPDDHIVSEREMWERAHAVARAYLGSDA